MCVYSKPHDAGAGIRQKSSLERIILSSGATGKTLQTALHSASTEALNPDLATNANSNPNHKAQAKREELRAAETRFQALKAEARRGEQGEEVEGDTDLNAWLSQRLEERESHIALTAPRPKYIYREGELHCLDGAEP